MSVWDWALAVYGRRHVQELTLRLQDEHGQNTSFLLWAVWAQIDDSALLVDAAEVARRWNTAALVPLREVRRTLKLPFAGVEDVARERLRQEVKAAELDAERVLMETLESLTRRQGSASAQSALLAAVHAWGEPAPSDLLSALARALD